MQKSRKRRTKNGKFSSITSYLQGNDDGDGNDDDVVEICIQQSRNFSSTLNFNF